MRYTGTLNLVRAVGDWLEEARQREPSTPERKSRGWLENRLVLWGILVLLFVVNLLETSLETLLEGTAWGEMTARWGTYLSRASLEFEPALSFAHHQEAGWTAVYGYSISYFFVFPALCVLVAVALSLRGASELRVFTASLVGAYLLSLPFFLGFPVLERWAFPDSGAVLLSDLWSSSLIDSIRPISGLDNCFPSTHTSFTVILILLSFHFGLRLKWTVLGLGLTVIASTFVLGIHWLPDIFAGGGVALASVAGARWTEARVWRRVDAETGAALSEGEPAGEEAPVEDEETAGDEEGEVGPGEEAPRIFLSYRRDDSEFATEAIYRSLVERFGSEAVFKDVDNIPKGVDFREHLANAVERCAVFIAVIGKAWHGPREGEASRIHEEEDFVRIEVEAALHRKIPLIPVLVQGVTVPGEGEPLPESLKDLAFMNGIEVRTARDLDREIKTLCRAVERHLADRSSSKWSLPFAAM